MPNSPEEKRKVVHRLKRLTGQAEALIRAVEAGVECASVLQQVAAMRGAINGLMAEVLESHLRETFGPFAERVDPEGELDGSIEHAVRLVHTYLK